MPDFPYRYVVECYDRSGNHIQAHLSNGSYDSMYLAMELAAQALWNPFPPMVAEIRIVDTQRRQP